MGDDRKCLSDAIRNPTAAERLNRLGAVHERQSILVERDGRLGAHLLMQHRERAILMEEGDHG